MGFRVGFVFVCPVGLLQPAIRNIVAAWAVRVASKRRRMGFILLSGVAEDFALRQCLLQFVNLCLGEGVVEAEIQRL